MDDLATLADITGPAVLNALLDRFKQGQYYTYCGDVLLSFNPCHDIRESESELGQWYRKSRPLQELPPHVVAIAHQAYQMLLSDLMPQAIVLSGRPGSGKTEAARRIISQLLREAGLSPRSGLGPRVIMAQHILTTLMTARTLHNADSTRGIKMATLYFRSDGKMVSAELQALCMDKWYLTERAAGCGAFSIFYAMLAGLSDREMQLYYLADKNRLLSRSDTSPVFLNREDHHLHLNMFDFFRNCLENTGIDEKSRNHSGHDLSAIFAVLAAILHFSNIDVITHAQTGQVVITNPHELRAACDLLSVRQEHLEAELLSTATVVRGEVARMACTEEQAVWNKEVLEVELYRRLLSVVITRLNRALSPDSHYIDHGPLTPITVVDSTSQEMSHQGPSGGLEAFLRNMASERIQHHLYDVIFHRDVEACTRDKVAAYKIKFAHNTELISAVFGPDYGIMNKLTSVTLDPQGTAEKFVALMDNDRSLKKTGCYVKAGRAVKSPEVFFIKHAGLGQVTYTARDFIFKNRASLPESTRQMMLHSSNPLVPVLANVTFHETGFAPDVTSPDVFFATRTFQSDLSYLVQTLENASLHYIRCMKASMSLIPGQFDNQLVTDQLKECCMVETARQRKYGYSTAMPQEQFFRCYRELAFSAFSRVTEAPEACKIILQKAGLLGKGVTLSKTSVFLRYWHVHRLLALKAEHLRRIVMVQAQLRGFLARRRFRRHVQAYGPRFGQRTPQHLGPMHPDDQRRPPHGPPHGQQYGRQDSDISYPGYANGSDRNYPEYANGSDRNHLGYARDFPGYVDDSASSIVADDPTGLYNRIIDKVLSSLETLEVGTWAKIIYMERGKQVAKVYVEERSIIIDGSNIEFDGDRLGLGLYRNQARDEETAIYRSRIIEGVRLKQDSDGSISACRLCDQPIVVKGLWNLDSAACCISEDVLLNRGRLPFEKTIKIFDMKEFTSKIALDLKQRCFSKAKMRRACVMGLAFGRDDADDTQTPCWLCIVNVKALTSLDTEGILRKAQVYTAELQMTSPKAEEEKLKADDVKHRHEREKWSRVDQREHLQEKEEGGRHVRNKLRAKGLPVGDHVGYSWDYNQAAEKTTMQDLQQMMEPERRNSRQSRGSGQARDWAKVETAVRDGKNRDVATRSASNLPAAADYWR